jgi:hypothetical protein
LDLARLLFIFIPSGLLICATLLALRRAKGAEIKLLRRAVAVFGVWAGLATGAAVATNFGSAFETIEVRNDSSRIVDVGPHYNGDHPVATGSNDVVDAVNGVDEVHVTLPDGRTITFRFSGKKRGEENVLTIRDASRLE